ncbi:hypothetical protein GALMADRAFT_139680 [Galerina marginata CBS 339.88]|uniref:Uncharacterized protein n=1 Tax=Galerina marginata (strain CBS 339.88) TaxID=685588 RepID=A0A067T0Y2_GALM3|nr:hypothetical protein GALMADRAFT_139680 [Galerina marginata CBS 339.88]
MEFQAVFTALISLVALTSTISTFAISPSAISIVDSVKLDIQAISAKFADINQRLKDFGNYPWTHLSGLLKLEREIASTTNLIKLKTLTNVGPLSEDDLKAILPAFNNLQSSISKTMKLFIAKNPTMREVPIDPNQKIYPTHHVKVNLDTLLHHITEFEKAFDLPQEPSLRKRFAKIETDIDLAFFEAYNAYYHK